MMWGYNGAWGGGWWGMGLGWLIPLAFLAVLIWIGVTLARRGGATPAGTGSNALAILKERYARGELTREQYEAMRKDIES